MDKYFVVFNGNDPNGMNKYMWGDIEDIAELRYENNTLKNGLLRKLKKTHFSNKLNRFLWLPFKGIWNGCLSIKLEELDPENRNYIIFSSAIKFSPSYIKKLKKRNACIVYYLMDTVNALNIAKNVREFNNYLKRYHVDLCYSFDPSDCIMYDLHFFDVYSVEKLLKKIDTSNEPETDLLYVGNCRSKERLNIVHKIYKLTKDKLDVDLYLVGVDSDAMKYPEGVHYNEPLQYTSVIEHSVHSKCIVELVNGKQTGNTLRFKEAVCFNLKLLTNNQTVLNSQFYNSEYIQVFDSPEKIDVEWIKKPVEVNYEYHGEFSPRQFMKVIVEADKENGGN